MIVTCGAVKVLRARLQAVSNSVLLDIRVKERLLALDGVEKAAQPRDARQQFSHLIMLDFRRSLECGLHSFSFLLPLFEEGLQASFPKAVGNRAYNQDMVTTFLLSRAR